MQEGQGTPSLSPTPSPAGSVGSVGSQSSGYSSGELANRGVAAAAAASGQHQQQQQQSTQVQPPHITVPFNVYTAMQKQNNHFGLLLSCHDLWEQAQIMVTDTRRDMRTGHGGTRNLMNVL